MGWLAVNGNGIIPAVVVVAVWALTSCWSNPCAGQTPVLAEHPYWSNPVLAEVEHEHEFARDEPEYDRLAQSRRRSGRATRS